MGPPMLLASPPLSALPMRTRVTTPLALDVPVTAGSLDTQGSCHAPVPVLGDSFPTLSLPRECMEPTQSSAKSPASLLGL